MIFQLGRLKDPEEAFRIGVDYTKDLDAGDSLISQTITAKQLDTSADATATFLELPTLAGALVSVRVKAGTAGKDYRVRFKAPTTLGATLIHSIDVRVRAS